MAVLRLLVLLPAFVFAAVSQVTVIILRHRVAPDPGYPIRYDILSHGSGTVLAPRDEAAARLRDDPRADPRRDVRAWLSRRDRRPRRRARGLGLAGSRGHPAPGGGGPRRLPAQRRRAGRAGGSGGLRGRADGARGARGVRDRPRCRLAWRRETSLACAGRRTTWPPRWGAWTPSRSGVTTASSTKCSTSAVRTRRWSRWCSRSSGGWTPSGGLCSRTSRIAGRSRSRSTGSSSRSSRVVPARIESKRRPVRHKLKTVESFRAWREEHEAGAAATS